MKQAIQKSTGHLVDGFLVDGGFCVIKNGKRSFLLESGEYDLIIESAPIATELCSTEPDWNQVRIQAAIAAMQGLCAAHTEDGTWSHDAISAAMTAVEYADSLITELKKQING